MVKGMVLTVGVEGFEKFLKIFDENSLESELRRLGKRVILICIRFKSKRQKFKIHHTGGIVYACTADFSFCGK